eukprot:scaffold5281_cov211-Isochrysis_galbana.AAC.6
MPRDDVAPLLFGPKHVFAQLLRALLPRLRQCEPALGVAVARAEVAARQEDEHDHRLVHVLLERSDVFEIVHVQEDAQAVHHAEQLPLDDGHLVLPRAPDVRQKEVVPVLFADGEHWGGAGPAELEDLELGHRKGDADHKKYERQHQ